MRAGGAPLLDPEALLAIRNLELRVDLIVEGFLTGLHRSPYHGFSAEFSEYRPYSHGDDLRNLDWRLLARTDRKYVKRFEEETNLKAHLLVDLSRSMAFGHERSPKAEYARTLAATLARFLILQRDAVGLQCFDEDLVEILPARSRPGHLQHLFAALSRPPGGKGTALVPTLEKCARLLRKRGLVVLFSDLLAPLDGLGRALGLLRARGQEVVLFRILDPAERDFPFQEASTFEDLESGRQLFVDPASAREGYQRRFAEHAEGLAQLCREAGAELVDWPTDRPLHRSLAEYLAARARRERRVRRRSTTGSAT